MNAITFVVMLGIGGQYPTNAPTPALVTGSLVVSYKLSSPLQAALGIY